MRIGNVSITKHYGLRGEWAELCFMASAAEHGIRAIKPWGSCCPYDFIAEVRGQFRRVQVKSTSFMRGNQYTCGLRGSNRKPYTKDDVDFFCVFIIPADIWYIIPFEALDEASHSINLSPHNSLARYSQCREAWHLLRGEEAEAQGTGG